MKLTIIVSDRAIILDGIYLDRIEQDLSWIPSNIHAVEWFGEYGDIQFNDGTPNERIEELGIFSRAITDHQNEVQRLKDEEDRREAARDYWKEFRRRRDALLYNCDWTQVADAPLTEQQREAWRVYRQALRDLPGNITNPKPLVLDPNHSSWPVVPN